MSSPFTLPVPALLLLGPTGVGKSPLGETIASRGLLSRKAHHLDFGSELRSLSRTNSSSQPLYSSQELALVHGLLHHGLLLENEHFPLARKIITTYLLRNLFGSTDLLLLNGIPRHIGQAHDIASLAHISAIIVLDCDADTVYTRLRNNVGGDRTERRDDGRELVAKKIQIFRERTSPLIDHYREKGSSIYHVPVTATSTTDDAYSIIASLASADPPVALITKPPQG